MRRAPGGGPLRPSALPLTQVIAPEARRGIVAAGQWLTGISTEAGQRFASVLNQELRKLCKKSAVNPPTQIHDEASVYYARPIFSHLFRTGRGAQKRSPSGAWYILYELIDTNGDGRPDVLGVVTILHAASQKPWEKDLEEDSEGRSDV